MHEHETAQVPSVRGAIWYHWLNAKKSLQAHRDDTLSFTLGQFFTALAWVMAAIIALALFVAYGNFQYNQGLGDSLASPSLRTVNPVNSGGAEPLTTDNGSPTAWLTNEPMVMVHEATFWDAYQTNSYNTDQFTMETAANGNGFSSYQIPRQLLAAAGVQCGDRIMFRVSDGVVNKLIVEPSSPGDYAACQHGAYGYTTFGK